MGRRRKFWLPNGTGKVTARGKPLPGYRVEWHEYHGPKRVHRSRTFNRRRDAQTWCRKQNARLDLEGLDETTSIALMDAAAEFLVGCQTLAKSTQRSYELTIIAFGRVTGDMTVRDITGSDIDRFVTDRMTPRLVGASNTPVARSTNTVRKHLRNLHRFLAWCHTRHYHFANPVKDATTKPKQRPAVRIRPQLTLRDVNRLVAEANTADRKLAILLAVTTGLDRGVLERLSTHQIDPQDRCIRLNRPKTGARLVLPLHAALWPHVASRMTEAGPRGRLLHGLLTQTGAKDWWNRLARRVGLEGVWFRDLKALAATLLQQHGATLTEAQHLLGHSSPEVTARHYSAPSQRIAEVLDSIHLPSIPEAPQSEAD